MKTYTAYHWHHDNEGGIAICHSKNFLGLHHKIGEFDTVDELIDILMKDDPEGFATRAHAEDVAYRMIEDLEYEEG